MTCPHRRDGQCEATPPDGGVWDCAEDCQYIEELLARAEKAEAENDLLWRCIRDLAIMLERDPDGIEEIAIEKNTADLAAVLGVGEG